MAPSRVVLLALLVATPALAGCNFADWYNQRGTVKVELVAVGADQSAIEDFETLKIAVYGVSLKQAGSIQTQEFTFGGSPLIVDLAATASADQRIPLAQTTLSLRQVESVTLRIEVVEAVDASGTVLPACHPGEPVESRPCVSTPRNGAYREENRPFSAERGGTIVYGFPLAVQYDQPTNEYYIQTDPEFATLVAE